VGCSLRHSPLSKISSGVVWAKSTGPCGFWRTALSEALAARAVGPPRGARSRRGILPVQWIARLRSSNNASGTPAG
jgi:hypothetical protein